MGFLAWQIRRGGAAEPRLARCQRQLLQLSQGGCGRKPSQQRLRGGLRDIALLLLLLAGAVAVVVAASIMVLVLAVWPVQVVVAVLLATQRLSGRQLRSTRQGALDD